MKRISIRSLRLSPLPRLRSIGMPKTTPKALPFVVMLGLLLAGLLPGSRCHLQAQSVQAPYHKSIQWFAYAGNHSVSRKWELHFDSGWRQVDAAPWSQWLVRTGANYQLTSTLKLSAAYGYFKTHPGGVQTAVGSFPEHRLEEQALISHQVGKVTFRHRFRADHRFVGIPDRDDSDLAYGLQHRARYLVRADFPLLRATSRRPAVSLGVYNEFMWRYDQKAGSAIDQNRLYGGLSVRLSPNVDLECGTFNQRLQPLSGGRYENNMVLVVAILTRTPLRKLLGRGQRSGAARPDPD